ncbi:large ribosomal subunit protein mL52 isoform X3 [Tamandua tetradactyla]|uniref:large ribosomal subunit protein mL52 isoform X3 n=1 Tax=Tamandua tetradactyla TaxID=48850 RepID=UPI004053BD8C
MAALGILLSTGVRRVHCSAAARAGGEWRLGQGLAANPSGYGPLTELPDWSYADGRPAPPMKGQLRRKAQREKLAVSGYSLNLCVTGEEKFKVDELYCCHRKWMLDYRHGS